MFSQFLIVVLHVTSVICMCGIDNDVEKSTQIVSPIERSSKVLFRVGGDGEVVARGENDQFMFVEYTNISMYEEGVHSVR